MPTRIAFHGDLPTWAIWLAGALAVASLALLILVELRRRERGGFVVVLTGLVSIGALLLAIVRPVTIAARESVVGAKLVVLADLSRSMALPNDGPGGASRAEVRDRLIADITERAKAARVVVLGFGAGPPTTFSPSNPGQKAIATEPQSDLTGALRALASATDERPQAVVVVSDGRLDDPPHDAPRTVLAALGEQLHVPIHTVATTKHEPDDASVRRVKTAGAAVAHVPFPLTIDVGCSGKLTCDEITVTARELREDGPPALLASGLAHIKDGKATLDLSVTLERAGTRIIEVAIASPAGDTIADNDRRLLTFHVARERVRVLHVAGRPTNDVRALRQWLKSDASVDVVAFFILRTTSDDPVARQDDLSLIPFPVDELFTEHLPSFDAVVLQDFDAQPYGLERHLPQLARYVRAGGGLIMVGGQNSFVAGGYAGTPLADVLPVELDGSRGATAADVGTFTPAWTEAGRSAPLLAPLRDIVGDELPAMPGSNVVGDLRPGALALWTHPTRTTKRGASMPILAVGDQGDGRSIALGIDGAWMLEFSALGARTSGRGYSALWDGLLGWLMRDPRFDAAQLGLASPCVSDQSATLRLRLPPPSTVAPTSTAAQATHDLSIELRRLDAQDKAPMAVHVPANAGPAGGTVEIPLPPLPTGGYTARLRVGGGPTVRKDFACESGGDEWADPRPDPDRLRALSEATQGSFVAPGSDVALPIPKPTIVSAERHVLPLVPPWAWSLIAAAALGAHWIARRRSGLS